VRTPEGEVTTIAELTAQGRIDFTICEKFALRGGGVGRKYFADLKGTRGDITTGWEIGEKAYLSRTGRI